MRKVLSEWSQEEIDELATETCECIDARIYAHKKSQKERAHSRIKAGKIGAQNRKKPITFYQLRASQTARLNNKEAAVEKRKNNLHRH